jgi:hypothetical protein
MKRYLLFLPLIFMSVGCSVSYNIGVNAYSSSGQNLLIPKESPIYVVTDSNAPNPIFKKEIAAKIRTLLNKNGYSTAAEKPGYYLLFDYGMSSGQSITSTIPTYHSGIYYGYPFAYGFRYSYTPYAPYYTVVYNRWLALKLIDGKAYRTSTKAEPLWISEVTNTGPGSDLRKTINYMLIAAFEHFGQDTGKRVNELLSEDDERIKLLIEPRDNR